MVWQVPCLPVPEVEHMDIESLDASDSGPPFTDRARVAQADLFHHRRQRPLCGHDMSAPGRDALAIELAAAHARTHDERRAHCRRPGRPVPPALGRRAPRHTPAGDSAGLGGLELRASPRARARPRAPAFGVAGGFTLDAAEHVGAAGTLARYDVLGLLSALVDKSLVQVNEKGDRYRLLETITAYAAEELAGAAEDVAAGDRHLSFFTRTSRHAEKGMWTSALPSWLCVLDAEHDNLRAAVDWSRASGQVDTGARLVCGIGQFLFVRCARKSRPAPMRGTARGRSRSGPARRAVLLGSCLCPVLRSPRLPRLREDPRCPWPRARGRQGRRPRGLGQVGRAQTFSDPLTALGTLEEALATARGAGDAITVVNCLC